jgi:hypothetical protein
MKNKIILSAVMLVLGIAARSEEPAAKQKEVVRFDGQTLALAWEGTNPDETVKEYIPEGEKLESWKKLASIREYPKLNDPKALAANLVQTLKKQNPNAPSSMIENPNSGEVMVDFITSPPDNSFVEFDIFKYSPKAGGGVVAQQYALREYKDIRTFLKGLKPERLRLLDLMVTAGLQKGK